MKMVTVNENVLALLVTSRVALDALADALTQYVQNQEDIEDDSNFPATELVKLQAARKMREAVDSVYTKMAD